MKQISLLCAVVFGALLPLHAQVPGSGFDSLQHREMNRYTTLARVMRTAADIHPGIDVKYYRLNIRVADQINFLSGDVVALSAVTDTVLAAIQFNLTNTMLVDSVLVDGTRADVSADASSIRITPPKAYHKGDLISTDVFYHGNPANNGFGSYTDVVRTDGSRWIYTLSEPYGARDWWPCVDHPDDKADSADIWITCARGMIAVSNGKLIDSLQNSDGTRTFKWKERYPIASYLIAATIANFNTFSDWYKYAPTDSMEVVNYVLPNIATTSPAYRANTALVPRMLAIYSSLFGQYPFVREKYGHVEFGWGGGMEHQTLTSLGQGAFTEGTIAHELAHQWFGDMITCRTWGDLWLNEGFAEYFETVYREKNYGRAAYFADIMNQAGGAKLSPGTLYVQDTTNVSNLFNTYRVYNKGAWVLHMLRHCVGDSLFFASIRAYANNPSLMYGTASTSDLRDAFERTTGRDLGWFFSEWVYGEKSPVYTCQYYPTQRGPGVVTTLNLSQTTGTTNPAYFTMPIDIRFASSDWDTTVTVFNNAQYQTFEIPMTHWPDTVQLDPNNWILMNETVKEIVVNVEHGEEPQTFFLAQNYPNPLNPATMIKFGVAEKSWVSIKVYDLLGRETVTLFEGDKAAGTYSLPLDASRFSSGVYLYRMTARHGGSLYSETKRLVVLK
jgi:aminopeptidase N